MRYKDSGLMKDVLIPLGLFLFIGFFVYAIIHTARKQRKAKAAVFRDFADKNGLRYQAEDDGTAVGFAKDFDGIGRFSSPSLGKVDTERCRGRHVEWIGGPPFPAQDLFFGRLGKRVVCCRRKQC